MVEVFLLSLIQGITEFIPVSSSSHLIIISNYLNFNYQNLLIDVSLHVGSFLAVITYFKKEIFNFINNKLLFYKILISSIPVMLIGFLLVETNLIEKLRNIKIIGWTTIIFGFILFISDKFKTKNNLRKNFTYKSAILIGILQILSLIPGVSRSGITMTGSRFLNFNRLDAAKISFLLSIPTLGAVSLFGFYNIIKSGDTNFTFLSLLSIFLSFIFSYITIKYFIAFVRKFSLNIFVIYRIILGFVILFFAYL